MSLEGNLTAFGLSEILQLIAVQQKSGMLSITVQDRSKVLFFREGEIISTRDRRRKTKDPLKDYLTRYGILSREDLIRLTQISAQSKLDLTEIIVSEGILTDEEMKTHFRNHIQEEVHDILTWEQCSYKFIPGMDIIDGIKTWGEHNIEGMLMESMRRIDEFPQAAKILPDASARISAVGEPEEDQELSSNEVAIRSLLDKERTASYLIGHAKIPQYETYEAIRHLYEKGLVEINLVEGIEVVKSDSPKGKKRKRRGKARKNVLPVAVSFLLFLASVGWGANSAIPHFKNFLNDGEMQSADSSIARNRAEVTLRRRLEAYYAQKGTYPPKLSHLAKAGLANEAFLNKINAYSFRYHLTAGGHRYTLL
jgi:hypothetical protein